MNRIENTYFDEHVLVDPNEPTPIHDTVDPYETTPIHDSIEAIIEADKAMKSLVMDSLKRYIKIDQEKSDDGFIDTLILGVQFRFDKHKKIQNDALQVESDRRKRKDFEEIPKPNTHYDLFDIRNAKSKPSRTSPVSYRIKSFELDPKTHVFDTRVDGMPTELRNPDILPPVINNRILELDLRLDPDPIIANRKYDERTFSTELGIPGDSIVPRMNSLLEELGIDLDTEGNIIFPKPQAEQLPLEIDVDRMKNKTFITPDPMITRSTTRYEDIQPWREKNL